MKHPQRYLIQAIFAVFCLPSLSLSCNNGPDRKKGPSTTLERPALSNRAEVRTPQRLFDGTSLKGWRIVDFAGQGGVEVETNTLVLSMGTTLTGISYTNSFPVNDYEISLKSARLDGNDFFCALTFPVQHNFCTLILGGWGGAVVGLSSIDGADASMNETTQYKSFEKRRWYAVRVRVNVERIEVWLDSERIIDLVLAGRAISLRAGDIEMSTPLGVTTWQTTAVIKDIELLEISPR